jgi:hypothetical protein
VEPTTAEIQEQYDTWRTGMYHPVQYNHGRHGTAVAHVEILLKRLKAAEDALAAVQNSEDGYVCSKCGRLDNLCGANQGLCRT